MKVIKVEKPFLHSVDGNTVQEYGVGEQVVSDRCALVAVEHLKVAKLTKKDPEKFLAGQAAAKAESADEADQSDSKEEMQSSESADSAAGAAEPAAGSDQLALEDSNKE